MIFASEKAADGAMDGGQTLVTVPVTVFLTRVPITELRCAISAVWREVVTGDCAPPVTPTMSETSPVTTPMRNRIMNRVSLRGNPSHTLQTRGLMRSSEQTKTCCSDGAVCGTALGDSSWSDR